jgi:arylsulfatase A
MLRSLSNHVFLKSFLLSASLCLTLSLFTPLAKSNDEQTDQPPNIVLIMIDDLAWMDLAVQGNPLLDTTNIDRLATQGVRMTDAYAAAPVCSPTRASIMTGQAPARLRITTHIPDRHQPEPCTLLPAETNDRLPLESVTIAERLKSAGYATAFLGKWHLAGSGSGDENFFPDRQGFDINLGGNGWGGPPSFFAPYEFPNVKSKTDDEYLPDRLADETIDFMTANQDNPFMMFLWNYTVHWPVAAKPDVAAKYADRTELVNTEYGAMVECMDQAIGRVLDAIDELELTDDTLLIFTSDNGGYDGVTSNLPLRKSKGYLYEGGIRVPMIARWPGRIEPGEVCDTPVVSTDLYPTILDAVGLEPVEDKPLDGISLLPLWTENVEPDRESICFHFPNYAWHCENRLGSAIRSGDYKLIHWFDDDSVELYNLREDLAEQKNIAIMKPGKAAELRSSLDQWLEDVDAAMPTPLGLNR